MRLYICYRFCRNKTSPRQFSAVNLLQVLPQQNQPSSVIQLLIRYRYCRNKTSPRQLYSCQFATGFATRKTSSHQLYCCQFATGFAATKQALVSYTAVNLLQVLPQQNKPSSIIQLSICYRFCHNKTSPRQLYSCQFAAGFATTKQLSVCYRFGRNKTTSRQYTAVNLLQILRLNT